MNHHFDPRKHHILAKFLPYLRLIRAFHRENFRQTAEWRYILRDCVWAIGAILMNGSLSIGTILMAWNLLESRRNADVLVVSVPMLMSLILVSVKFVALMEKSVTISAAIERIQQRISQRELFLILS